MRWKWLASGYAGVAPLCHSPLLTTSTTCALAYQQCFSSPYLSAEDSCVCGLLLGSLLGIEHQDFFKALLGGPDVYAARVENQQSGKQFVFTINT